MIMIGFENVETCPQKHATMAISRNNNSTRMLISSKIARCFSVKKSTYYTMDGTKNYATRKRERERERERIVLRSIVNMMIHVQIKITMWIDPRRPALRPWRSLAHRPP